MATAQTIDDGDSEFQTIKSDLEAAGILYEGQGDKVRTAEFDDDGYGKAMVEFDSCLSHGQTHAIRESVWHIKSVHPARNGVTAHLREDRD